MKNTTKDIQVSNITLNHLPINLPREISITAIQIYGFAMIKLSDYKKYREEFNLDERQILIAPDSLWEKLALTVGKK